MKVVMIGSGRVALTLGAALIERKHQVVQVFSRNKMHASRLSSKLKCSATSDFKKIIPDADLYVVAVKDDAIAKVLSKFSAQKGIVIHTAGAIGINVFKNKFKKCGVLWPMHSFSDEISSMQNSLIAVEGSDTKTLKTLSALAQSISNHVIKINSEQRLALHCSAVFANNFTNYFYSMASDILSKHKISFELLQPIIAQTANKVKHSAPKNSQTGPAFRNEKATMKKHLSLLKKDKEKTKLYKTVSSSIQKYYSKGND